MLDFFAGGDKEKIWGVYSCLQPLGYVPAILREFNCSRRRRKRGNFILKTRTCISQQKSKFPVQVSRACVTVTGITGSPVVCGQKVVGRSFMAKVLVSRRCVVSCTEGVDDTSEKKEHTYCCQTDLCNSAVTSINRLPAAVALFVAVKPIIMAIRLYK